MMLKLFSGAAVAALMALPAVSQAQYAPGYHGNSGYYDSGAYGGSGYRSNDYDGYCYMRRHNAGNTGTVVGALAGGAIGGTFSDTHHKGVGTALGAVVGGVAGNAIGRSSVKCYNGDYYAYQDGYYEPGPAPDGYEAVYFHDRPEQRYYSHVYTSRPSQYGYSSYDNDDAYDDGYHHDDDDDDGYTSQDSGYGYQGAPCASSCGYSVTYSQPYTVYDGSSYYDGTSGTAYGSDQSYAPAATCTCGGQWHDDHPQDSTWRDSNGVWHQTRRSSYSYSRSSYGY